LAWGGVLAIPTGLMSRDFGNVQQDRPEAAWLGSSSAQTDLGVLAVGKLNVSQQLAIKKANSTPGCISGSAASRSRKVITSPCSALVRLHLEHSVRFWAPNIRKMLINYRFSRRPPQRHGLSTSPRRRGQGSLAGRRGGFGGT